MTRACPGCGAAISEPETVFCPYCGRELTNLGRQITDQKIEAVKKAQSETMAVPKKIGLVAGATLLVLFLLFMAAVFFDIPGKMRESGMERDISRRSRDMKEAYEDEDWEQLEQYLIDECEDYIGAPDYFLYRTAWYLHTFPPQFDEAMAAHDTTEMLKVYEVIAEDYNMRSDEIFYRIYKTEDAVEKALKEEVERETEILTEEGLEDEMYKLRR